MNRHFILILVSIILIYTFVWLSQKLLYLFTEKSKLLDDKKSKTLLSVWKTSSNYLALSVSFVLIISPFIDLTKILAGAGVLGIILGFGSQSLIKDFLKGFFLLYEGQLKKDDFVTINQTFSGTVEEVDFRATKIRDMNGKLLSISNGDIVSVLNGNIDKRRIVEKIVVSFRENPSKIEHLLLDACKQLNEELDSNLKKDINGEPIEAFKYVGLTSLNTDYHGYEYAIAATIHDHAYFNVSLQVRKLLAQMLYDNQILLGERTFFQK